MHSFNSGVKASSLVGHSAQLLRIIRKSPQPADVLTASYMRERKYIGASDRRAISALVFLSLRCLHSVDLVWKSVIGSVDLASSSELHSNFDLGSVLSTLVLADHWGCASHLSPLFKNQVVDQMQCEALFLEVLKEKDPLSSALHEGILAAVFSAFAELTKSSDAGALSVKSCLSEWICLRFLHEGRNADQIESLGRSLLHPAPLTVRANVMLCSAEQLRAELVRQGLEAELGSISPHAVRIRERAQLTQLELFRSGYAEVHDESSQLVAFAVDPDPSWRILDACAGAGGKSLHLAVVQGDKGSIIASDAEPKRMRELYSRASRANIRSIKVQALAALSEDERVALHGSFDAVLIDAPCTGMGTVRRSPLLKWRLSEDALHRMSLKQRDILREYSVYVKPGGTLVYVTCSILREENEDQIQHFLDAHPEFQRSSLQKHFEKFGLNVHLNASDSELRVEPQDFGSDGFFIARMERVQ